MSQSQARAPSSGKIVTMNLSMDQCLVFDFATIEDLTAIIENYNIKRYKTFWEKNLSQVISDNGKTYLEAFKSRMSTSEGKSLYYFKSSFIQEVLCTKEKATALVDLVQALPIEEQRRILVDCTPTSREEVNRILRIAIAKFGINMLDRISEYSDAKSFIDQITYEVIYEYAKNRTFQNSDLLIAFWAGGLLLLPQNFQIWKSNSRWGKLLEANPKINDLIKQIYIPSKSSETDGVSTLIANFFCVTSITEKADLSIEMIYLYSEYVKKIQDKQVDTEKHKNFVYRLDRAISSLLICYNIENPDTAVEVPNRRSRVSQTAPRDIHFGWVAKTYPKLTSWAHYFHLFLSASKAARLGQALTALNVFLDYLGTLDKPPSSPWLVERHIHIYDPSLLNKNTFFEYLLSHGSTNGRRFKSILGNVRRFFPWLRDYLIANGQLDASNFNDPILDTDKLGQLYTNNRTTRDSLPPFLITEMKSALIENDFELPKSFHRSTVRTTDQETGYSVRVFYPGIAICMFSLLDTPIRSHQARWLDSGLLDEKIYNFSNKKLEYNSSPFAIKGRKEGVLQVNTDALRAESWLSMWVNTNKTGDYKSGLGGYHIPYVSPELEKLFKIQLEWSKKFLPELRSPLKYREYMQDVREFRPDVVKGPEVSPLFRDPTTTEQKTPISYTKLVRFYTLLLGAVEDRIFEKHGHRLKLVTIDENGKRSWAVDLHTLRVSGITNLIEAGVPIEVVQQYVAGHKVLIMTLHYLKYSPGKLRRFIEDAHQRMQDDQDFVGSQSFINAINEFTPFLLSQSGAGNGPGFDAFNMGDGIFIVNSDGICPGTSCSTGMLIKEGQNQVYGHVPGKRCGLCRYWITGPAHLLGQITAVNNLAYAIRKKGQELARLNELKLDAEDASNRRLARELRDRIDLLNRDIELDVTEWTSRYHYAEQSITQMDDYLRAKNKIIATDSTPLVPMITPSSPLELKVTLEHAHEFALLDQITQMAAFNPGFANLQAELEKHHVLSKMMMANGMKPFLLTLSDEHAREAGNLLSALVLQQVGAKELDAVLAGEKPLEDYPYLRSTLHALEEAARSGQEFLPHALSKLSELLVPTNPIYRANYDEDEGIFG